MNAAVLFFLIHFLSLMLYHVFISRKRAIAAAMPLFLLLNMNLSEDDLAYFQGLGCFHGRSYCLHCDVAAVPGTLRRVAYRGWVGWICSRANTQKMPNVRTENVCIWGRSARPEYI